MLRGGARGLLPLIFGLALAAIQPAEIQPAESDPVEAADKSSAPVTVASIRPVHSLAAGVMAGVGEPLLLVRGRASPHGHALRPSEARVLSHARIVFWIGAGLESFLEKPLASLAREARVVTLSRVKGVHLLPGESTGSQHPRGLGSGNSHIWLDPRNARAMTEAMVEALAGADSAHAPQYRRNGERIGRALAKLEEELAALLAPLAGRPFVVAHDAYGYFQARFGLKSLGAITLNPDRPPGARWLLTLRNRIRRAGNVCLLEDADTNPRWVNSVVEGAGIARTRLDPLGATLPPGEHLYFTLMRNLANSMAACLEDL